MKTVILCGGYGTRLRDVSHEMPKPLVPIGNLPILIHLMRYYALWDRKDFVLCLGYKKTEIIDFFSNIQAYTQDSVFRFGHDSAVQFVDNNHFKDWTVTMAHTGLDTLTGSRVSKIRRYVADDDNFMLTYADGLSDVDLDALMDFHRSHGKLMTVTGVTPPGRFGEMVFGNNGEVHQFNEKPAVTPGLVSGGFFVCRKEIFDYLPEDGNYMLEQEPMKLLAEAGEMRVFQHEGFWHPMDAPRDYNYLNKIYAQGDAPWTSKP